MKLTVTAFQLVLLAAPLVGTAIALSLAPMPTLKEVLLIAVFAEVEFVGVLVRHLGRRRSR